MVSQARGLRPAVFLDRDGVIVVPEFRDQRSYAPRRLEDFRLYPDAAGSLQRLKRAGFLLAVVTNQPDVGNGLTLRSEVEAMHEIMTRELAVDAAGLLPWSRRQLRLPQAQARHDPGDGPGTRRRPREELHGGGSQERRRGRARGRCATVFIDLGYAEPAPAAPDFTVHSIAEAADVIIENAPTRQEVP
jgi:D-glycero-D-manno-heptose 1,7-bisphosphate phosphatase